ncbi:MAG: Tll0287-like domain-containing protein [Mangrovicoccus sp.]
MTTFTANLKNFALAGAVALTGAVASAPAQAEMDEQQVADLLHLVMSTDRTVYTRMIVNRLAVKEKVIKASEHFMDDKALVLPAQMFRFGAEAVAEETDAFSYSLLSLWPINKQNGPQTDAEKEGLEYIAENVGENWYGEEELGGTTYFTAVYPDTAVAEACTSCHNDHKDSPRTDFELGEVMGGVVIRIPMDG